jgi:hypothetical protein
VSAARLAARVIEILGPVEGGLLVAASPRLGEALARLAPVAEGAAPGGAVVSFLGAAARPAERQAVLADLGARLTPGAPLVVVDHNQPRVPWRRPMALATLLLAGLGPARARYPVARELAAAGFRIERLRLTPGERVQLVLARKTPAQQTGTGTPGPPARRL